MTRGLRTWIRQPLQICFRGQEKQILLHAQDTEFATSKENITMPNQTLPTTTTRLSLKGKSYWIIVFWIQKTDKCRFYRSVFEKVVKFLDMFYEGDLPLRNGTDLVEKFKNYFSKEKFEEDLSNFTSGKKRKSDKEDKSETNQEKQKMELLRHRVKEIITEYPFFTKAEQFFVRVLEVGQSRRCCLITSNDTVFALTERCRCLPHRTCRREHADRAILHERATCSRKVKTNTRKPQEISFVVFNWDLEGSSSSSAWSRNEGKRGKALKRKVIFKNYLTTASVYLGILLLGSSPWSGTRIHKHRPNEREIRRNTGYVLQCSSETSFFEAQAPNWR